MMVNLSYVSPAASADTLVIESNLDLQMVVVSKEQQLNASDIALEFLINVIGPKHAKRVLAVFTTISSLGNIIGMTFTVSKVKQEIAKDGIIPFAKFFGENRTLLRRWRSKIESDEPEPTPIGALFLHWLSAVFLILLTWPAKPASAYRILVNLYVYLTDVVPSFIMAIGMLYLRFFTDWSAKSLMPSWLSVLAGSVYALANGFPLVAVWIPPTHTSGDVYDLIPGFPWYITGALSWALLSCGVLYWVCFRYILPRVGARRGKVFIVEREPVFRMQDGERVQWHEIVLHSWIVKAEPEKRAAYTIDDI
jgi:hypothetical protein